LANGWFWRPENPSAKIAKRHGFELNTFQKTLTPEGHLPNK